MMEDKHCLLWGWALVEHYITQFPALEGDADVSLHVHYVYLVTECEHRLSLMGWKLVQHIASPV